MAPAHLHRGAQVCSDRVAQYVHVHAVQINPVHGGGELKRHDVELHVAVRVNVPVDERRVRLPIHRPRNRAQHRIQFVAVLNLVLVLAVAGHRVGGRGKGYENLAKRAHGRDVRRGRVGRRWGCFRRSRHGRRQNLSTHLLRTYLLTRLEPHVLRREFVAKLDVFWRHFIHHVSD